MGLGRATRLQQQHWISPNVDDTATKAWVTSKEVCLMYDVQGRIQGGVIGVR